MSGRGQRAAPVTHWSNPMPCNTSFYPIGSRPAVDAERLDQKSMNRRTLSGKLVPERMQDVDRRCEHRYRWRS